MPAIGASVNGLDNSKDPIFIRLFPEKPKRGACCGIERH
jgi:hypothetical protein